MGRTPDVTTSLDDLVFGGALLTRVSSFGQRLLHFRSRLTRAWHRMATDGRIPRSTWDLYSAYWKARLRGAINSLTGALTTTVGGSVKSSGGSIRPAADSRSWHVAEGATKPAHQLVHENATMIVGQLISGGLRPFLIDGDDESTHFGLPAESRSEALDVLRSLADGPWYLSWVRGGSTHVDLLRRVPEKRAGSAESWRLFRLLRTGRERFIGRAEGVTISFWILGDEGNRERLGYRGLSRFEPDVATETTETIAGRDYPGLDQFPVGHALGYSELEVDFVFTWVDDNDPAWSRDFAEWAGSVDQSSGAAHPSRFRSLDELKYSLRSVWLYAGWFSHLYLVTSGQVPEWLQEHPRLTVVSHSEIMPQSALPTFSSHAIEASLHHIPGLAEHFVYMNDDVFLARPLGRDRFFSKDGQLKYVESEAMMPVFGDAASPAVELAAINNRRAIQGAFGKVVRWRLDHSPHALLKSVMYEAEELFEQQLADTVSRRFRHPEDLSLASGLTQFVAASTGRGVPGDLNNRYMNIENERFDMFLEVLRFDDRIDSFCVNQTDARSSDNETGTRVKSFLDDYLSIPAPWERS